LDKSGKLVGKVVISESQLEEYLRLVERPALCRAPAPEAKGGGVVSEIRQANSGIAGAVAQALIGHDSEAIHEHYVNVGREALQKAAAVFPSI
jgi:hypothetical protein